MQIYEAQKKYGEALARPVAETWEVVIRDLERNAETRARRAVAAIYLRHEARTLADTLAGQPLADAVADAQPGQRGIAAAKDGLAKAVEGYKDRLQRAVKTFKPGDDTLPKVSDREVQTAEQAVTDARTAAQDTDYHLRQLREKIEALRVIPEPDAEDLAILTAALGCTCGSKE